MRIGRRSTQDESPAAGTILQAGEQRSASIESLRAISAIFVVVSHAAQLTLPFHGSTGLALDRALFTLAYAGLAIFFAISGYLIYFPFAKRDFGNGGPVNLRRYATNRALRILPLYFIVITVVLAFQYHAGSVGLWARFLSLSQNFNEHTAFRFLTPSWSVVVELHYYILLPFLALAVAALARRSARPGLMILGGLTLASLLIRIATVYVPPGENLIWRGTILTSFMFIGTGMLASILHVNWEQQRPAWLRGRLLDSDLWLLASVPFLLSFVVLFTGWSLDYDLGLPIFAFLVTGAVSLPYLQAGPVTRLLWWRPLAALGIATYSLYLWHVPVIALLKDQGLLPGTSFLGVTAIVLPVTIVVALLSFRYIERPILGMRERWSGSAPAQTQRRPDPAPAEQPAAP